MWRQVKYFLWIEEFLCKKMSQRYMNVDLNGEESNQDHHPQRIKDKYPRPHLGGG